jgi:branched-subunit amino acid aminotransferase/4-amino-4-deoxychorismate lyase
MKGVTTTLSKAGEVSVSIHIFDDQELAAASVFICGALRPVKLTRVKAAEIIEDARKNGWGVDENQFDYEAQKSRRAVSEH